MVQHQLVCFTSLPNINQLLYTFATLDEKEIVKTSQYNLTILKCRQLLFENSNVLACPNLEGLFGIYIVAKECFFQDGSLFEYFKKRNLKPGTPSYPHKYIYEECCYYTIIAKLAPKWNMVSNYLVYGRDFLTETNAIDAMHLTININERGDTSFAFTISCIQLPSMTLDKLDLHRYKVKEYQSKNVLHLTKFDSKAIRVLPSLKRAKILSIRKVLDEKSAIQTYQQMKRHWKNTYGYRLPESDVDIFYVQVKFFEGSLEFTYPSICVRPYEPVFMQRVDPGPVVSVFVADLMKKVPTILGDSYKVPTYLSDPSHDLNSFSQELPHPIASDVGTQPLPKYKQNISATQNSAFAILPTQKCVPANQISVYDSRSKLTQLISQLNKPQNRTTLCVSQQTPSTPFISETQPPQFNFEISQKTDRIVKMVNSKKSDVSNNSENNAHKSTLNSKSNKSWSFTPAFQTPKATEHFHVNNKNKSTVVKELKNQLDFLNNCVAQRQNDDRKSTSNSENDFSNNPQNIINGQKFAPKLIPKIGSRKNTTNLTNEKDKIAKPILTHSSNCSAKQDMHLIESSINKKIQLQFTINSRKSKIDNSRNISMKRADSPTNMKLNQPKFIKDQMKEISHTNPSRVIVPNLLLKRKQNITDCSIAKKLRDNASEINNMGEYVAQKTIDNLTVPTLVNWLREKSVKCTKNDRKSDLNQKFTNFYQHN